MEGYEAGPLNDYITEKPFPGLSVLLFENKTCIPPYGGENGSEKMISREYQYLSGEMKDHNKRVDENQSDKNRLENTDFFCRIETNSAKLTKYLEKHVFDIWRGILWMKRYNRCNIRRLK